LQRNSRKSKKIKGIDMYIKRYTITALIFIILVGWYVYAFVTQNSMGIDFFGIPLPSLSIALWVVIPLIIFYFASVGHMAFYSFLGSLKLRKYEKDYEKLIDSIVDAYLGKEDRNHQFKTPRYNLLGLLIDNTTLFPSQTLTADTKNEKIDNIINIVEDIKSGNVVELKKFSLSPENALFIQNERNRYKKGDISNEEILKNSTKYDESLCKEAYADYAKIVSFSAIEQYKCLLTKETLFDILARIGAKERALEVSNEELILLFKNLDLDSKDYLKISTILASGVIPERRIKLFESLSEENEDAMDAYLFTLFDLEMLAPADEILENSQSSEYLNFKAYRALKESNKHFNINLFV